MFASDSILPDPPDGAEVVLHDREYRVRAFRIGPDRLVLQGAIRDQKPPGLYLPGDPNPLTIHHMQLALTISFPDLTIVEVTTNFETYPMTPCPAIVDRYDQLIGVSIARGFTNKVRELFGGPRGCTHTTALLQAMAPVAVQTFWSMRSAELIAKGATNPFNTPSGVPDDTWQRNINTCHVWAEDGAEVAARKAGEPWGEPVFIRMHLAKTDK